ncbi:Tify domain binding domain [Dillenia turbinata]|uniref:Ninja-family protein n=1 Tax=Dillenia turbinata TaxID=194707 RepID=A0AAN8USK3_9MAGN
MAADRKDGNQPQPRQPRFIIDLINRRYPPPIANPEDVDLSLSLSIGYPREGQGPPNENNHPVQTPSSSSSSDDSGVMSTDEGDIEGANIYPPLMTNPASTFVVHEDDREVNRLRMKASRLQAKRRMQRRRREKAATAATARVQGEERAPVTRSPTLPPIAPERAMASAMRHPALHRALRRMQEEGLVSPRHPLYGMNLVRIPPGIPTLRIGSRTVERMSPTGAEAAEVARTEQPNNNAHVRNRRLSFEIAPESSARRARTAEVNEFGVDVVQMMPSVTTVGNGPFGRRIEGVLYKFSDDEELKIVCVCHGRFFNPAGFYKHAGGTDVPNPSRYITVVDVPINGPNASPNAKPNNIKDGNEASSNGDGDHNELQI